MRQASKSANASKRYPLFFICSVIILLVFFIALPSGALAANITVNSTADNVTAGDGNCTLREAINNANTDTDTTSGDCAAGSGDDAIRFSVNGTITLGSTLPTITSADELTIEGGSAVTISGNNAVQMFIVDLGASLTLQNLTVANGNAGFGNDGGGIVNHGTLAITNSTLTGNKAGLLANLGGGAIDNDGGTVTITNSTLSGNSADDATGGGIFNSGTVTITNSTLSGNSADRTVGQGGGIFNSGIVTITSSTLSGNSGSLGGGGISNLGTITIINSTLSGNSALESGSHGGGIDNGGTITMTNSTLSGNSAGTSDGGGIANSFKITITNSIVASNPGGNCLGTITDGGYNIDDGTTCGFSTANNSKPSTNPLLDPAGLKDNGGPTQTIALCAASGTPSGCTGKSPAIDTIPNGINGCGTTITTDQRGLSRPDPEDNSTPTCDIGAFELQEVPLDCSKASPSVSTILPQSNHKFVPVNVLGVTDPDGDSITITITSIFQDEKVIEPGSGKTCPDATGVGTSTANVLAERNGNGDGRVYHIRFSADDGNGGTCTGEVKVCVPLNPDVSTTCVDEGALFDSTVCK